MGDGEKYEFLAFNVKVLTFLNLWLRDGETDELKWRQLKTYYIVMLTLPSSAPALWECFFIFREDDVEFGIKMQVLVGCVCVYLMFYMAACFLKNRKMIKEIVDEIESFRAYSNLNIYEVDRHATMYSKGFLIYSIIGTLIYISAPLLSVEYCEEHRYRSMETYGVPCGVPSKFRLPFRYDKFPLFHFYVAHELFLAAITTTVVVTLAMLLSGLLLHVINQLKQLRICILNLSKSSEEEIVEAVRFLVKYHIAIIEFTKKINKAFGTQLILYITLTSFVISILGFVILIVNNFTESLRFGMHLLGWFILLFLICHYGQLLIDESMGVAQAAYYTEWYKSPVRVQKDIRMIIMRAQKPLTLKAINLGELSAPTFLHVLSSAYSYFTLLLQLKK